MRWQKFISVAILISFIASPLWAVAKTPTDDLKATLDEVIKTLADKKADPVKRKALVVEKIKADFDFESMCRFILGPNWQSATPEQRKKFIERYTRILEDTYVGRLEAYTDEKVQFVAEKMKGDKALVETLVVSSTNKIAIDYRLWLDKEKWRVYDVSIEGVSLVRNFQDTYKQVIRKEGIDGLLVQMETIIKDLEQKK